jgi:hypothetical protein
MYVVVILGGQIARVQAVWEDVSHDQPFKAFYLGVPGDRDYGGLLETCRYYKLGQGEVENDSEDTCQLVSACSEYTSKTVL